MNERAFQVITIVAARKAEFYVKTKRRLLASLPSFISDKEARLRLRRAISELDDTMFIGGQEIASRTIDPGLSVDSLNLDVTRIVDQVATAMAAT